MVGENDIGMRSIRTRLALVFTRHGRFSADHATMSPLVRPQTGCTVQHGAAIRIRTRPGPARATATAGLKRRPWWRAVRTDGGGNGRIRRILGGDVSGNGGRGRILFFRVARFIEECGIDDIVRLRGSGAR